jgi:hypothetical protein
MKQTFFLIARRPATRVCVAASVPSTMQWSTVRRGAQASFTLQGRCTQSERGVKSCIICITLPSPECKLQTAAPPTKSARPGARMHARAHTLRHRAVIATEPKRGSALMAWFLRTSHSCSLSARRCKSARVSLMLLVQPTMHDIATRGLYRVTTVLMSTVQ